MRKVIGLLTFVLLAFLVNSCTSAQPTLTNFPGTPRPPMPTVSATQVALGRNVYQANCANCHGANAEGAPNWKKPDAKGNYPPPPHDDSGHTWHHSDRLLYDIIRDGSRDPMRPDAPQQMPAFGNKLNDAEIRAVLIYLASLWTQEHREFQWERTVDDMIRTPPPPR
ncbi:MAG: cytochrome c [Chloroflexi bacterium]|nr:cytochrome c [Chloroflexota bacterium]